MNCSRVEDHASEGTVLNVLIVIGHMNLPLPSLVRLEGGVESSVVLAHWTAQGSVGGTVGRHLQQLRAGGVVRIDLNNKISLVYISTRPKVSLTSTSTVDPTAQGSIPS